MPPPPRDPRPPAPVGACLTWAARHAADRAPSWGVREGPRAMAQRPRREPTSFWARRPRAAEGARKAGSRRPGPAPAPAAAPRPGPATWGTPSSAAAARTGSPGTAAPLFPLRLEAPRSHLSTSGAGLPPRTGPRTPYTPAACSLRGLRSSRPERSRGDLAPPERSFGGGLRVRAPSPSPPRPLPRVQSVAELQATP